MSKIIPVNITHNAYPATIRTKRTDKFETLSNVRQSNKTSRSSGGTFTGQIDLNKQMTHGSAHGMKQNLRSVSNNSNRNDALTENVAAQQCFFVNTARINDFIDSLPNSTEFSYKIEQDAIEFWKTKKDINGFGGLLSALSAPGSDDESVQKVKQVLVMTKMLHDSCADNDISRLNRIKADIQLLVNNVNEYKLGFDSLIAGSSGEGFERLNSFDGFIDRISNEAILRGFDYNKEIHTMVMNKIEAEAEGDLRNVLHQMWEGDPFRESIRVFENMEKEINRTSGFLRAGALFSHQPIKLDLFRDYLKREGGPKKNDETKDVPVKKEADTSKENQGVTYIYNDYSINVNDFSKVIIGDRVNFKYNDNFTIKIHVDKSKPQNETAFSSTVKTRSQHFDDIPETTAGTSEITVNSNKPCNETLTPPVTAGEHAGVDDIDGPALPREASSTPETNAELNVRTSVPQAQPQRVATRGSSTTTPQTSLSSDITVQKTSIIADSGRVDKKNGSPITPSDDAGSGIKNDVARSPNENVSRPNPHIKAGESPVKDGGVNPTPNAAPYRSNATGRGGDAARNRYWQSAKLTTAKTDTQAAPQTSLSSDITVQKTSITPDSGQVDKKNGSPITPSNVANTGTKNDGAHLSDENIGNATPYVKVGESPVKDGGVNQTPNAAPYRSYATGRTGDAARNHYWQSANLTTAKTDTQARPREPLPGRAEKELLTRSNAAGSNNNATYPNASTVRPAPNEQSSIGRDAKPLDAPISSSTIERRIVNQRDAAVPANRDDVASSEGKKGNPPYKGPFWTGRQGAAAKDQYIASDSFAKRSPR